MKGKTMQKARRTLTPAALAALAWLSGTGPVAAQASAPVEPAAAVAAAAAAAQEDESRPYQIQRGDQLGVKLFYHPSLNEEVTVRPDGRISLQLLDEVEAAGLTPKDLAAQLKARYSERLESPEVSVIVKTFSARRIYVAGEVAFPGEHPLAGRTTVLQAIALARGFKETARVTQVVIVRRNPDFTPHVMTVNLKKVVEGSDLANDVVLLPYDVVYVPRSTIANVNKFVKEFIVNNIPVDFGIRFDLVPQ